MCQYSTHPLPLLNVIILLCLLLILLLNNKMLQSKLKSTIPFLLPPSLKLDTSLNFHIYLIPMNVSIRKYCMWFILPYINSIIMFVYIFSLIFILTIIFIKCLPVDRSTTCSSSLLFLTIHYFIVWLFHALFLHFIMVVNQTFLCCYYK